MLSNRADAIVELLWAFVDSKMKDASRDGVVDHVESMTGRVGFRCLPAGR